VIQLALKLTKKERVMKLPNISGWIANRIVNLQDIKNKGDRTQKLVKIHSTIQKVAIVVAFAGLAAIGLGIAAIFVTTLPFHWPVSLLAGGAIAGLLGTYTAIGGEKGKLANNARFSDNRPFCTRIIDLYNALKYE